MKINIKATGMDLTEAITDYVTKKISTIEKYLSFSNGGNFDTDAMVAYVEVGKSTHHHKSGNVFCAEVHISGMGIDLYAMTEMDDLYAAIDIVRDEIIHSASQTRGKQKTLARRSGELVKNIMKGLTDQTTKGLNWGLEKLKSGNFRRRK